MSRFEFLNEVIYTFNYRFLVKGTRLGTFGIDEISRSLAEKAERLISNDTQQT